MAAADRRPAVTQTMQRRDWLAAAFLLIAGCSAAGRDAHPRGSLVTERCQAVPADDARCATFSVAEDRSKPDGRAIGLRVTILPATGGNPAPDPVFYLAGGPGQAASVLLNDPSIVGSSLRERRALVFIDQRGTGGSHGLECPFYGPPGNAQSYFQPFLPIDKVRACRAALSATTDLAQYTTAASVEDLDEVRAALGYQTINLIGGSYGTRLAMEYVRRFETRARAVILEGPVPSSRAVPHGFGRMAQDALDALLAECASNPACANAFPRLRDEAAAVFDRLRKGPVTASVRHAALEKPAEVTVTRDNLAEAIRYMTYSSRQSASVPIYLHEAFQENYSPIAQFLMQHRADGTFDALYLSITCAEDVPFVPASAAEDDDPTYLGGYRVREQRAACAEWPRGTAPPSHREPVTAKTPVLVFSGALDPVTPPAFGDEVARTLPNSLHLTVPYSGHSAYGLNGLDCLSRIRRDFIERATVAGLDVACVAAITRGSFRTSR